MAALNAAVVGSRPRCSPSPTRTRAGSPARCGGWSPASRTSGSATSAARCASRRRRDGDNQEGLYWRYEMAVREMESGLAGVTAGNGAINAVRREAYIGFAPGPRPGHLVPVRAGQARLARRVRAAGAGDEPMAPTIEGEFRRKRRMMAGAWNTILHTRDAVAARLRPAVRAGDLLAPAAALRDADPAPGRARRPTSRCSARERSTPSRWARRWRCWPRPLLGRLVPLAAAARSPAITRP